MLSVLQSTVQLLNVCSLLLLFAAAAFLVEEEDNRRRVGDWLLFFYPVWFMYKQRCAKKKKKKTVFFLLQCRSRTHLCDTRPPNAWNSHHSTPADDCFCFLYEVSLTCCCSPFHFLIFDKKMEKNGCLVIHLQAAKKRPCTAHWRSRFCIIFLLFSPVCLSVSLVCVCVTIRMKKLQVILGQLFKRKNFPQRTNPSTFRWR